MHVLAISGSLRAASLNSALLRALRTLAPPQYQIEIWQGLGQLPLYNPDLEPAPPASVNAWRQQVAAADAILIASPEYAHGVTGSLKNALDWLVSFPPFAHKTVAVLNASPRAWHADAALKETLRTMSADLAEPACLCVPLLGSQLDEAALLRHPELCRTLGAVLDNLLSWQAART